MATAFSATLIHGPTMTGPDVKQATYLCQMASTYTANGETVDTSGEFNFIYGIAGWAVENDTDADAMDSLVLIGGTYDSTDKGYPAATVKIAGYDGGTEITGDMSGITNLMVTFIGK